MGERKTHEIIGDSGETWYVMFTGTLEECEEEYEKHEGYYESKSAMIQER